MANFIGSLQNLAGSLDVPNNYTSFPLVLIDFDGLKILPTCPSANAPNKKTSSLIYREIVHWNCMRKQS